MHTERGWRIAGELVLPWPPLELSPNTASHWRAKAKAKAAYRESCRYIASRTPCYDVAKSRLRYAKEARLEIEFHPPSLRSYDLDNLLARMKSGLDGLADSWVFNDKIIKEIEIKTPAGSLKGNFVKLALYVKEILDE